jgi:sugar phosphate isomerase/epimerase
MTTANARKPWVMPNSLPGAATATAPDILRQAARDDFGGVLFSSMFSLSERLDEAEVTAVRKLADDLGLTLAASLWQLSPLVPGRARDALAAGDGVLLDGLQRLVRVAAASGIHDLMCMVGSLDDRTHPTIAWADQLAATRALFDRIVPLLRDLGCRLSVKTHEELSSFELARLIEGHDDVLFVALDPVNSLCRMEDPLAAARRLAGRISLLHVDDAVLRFEEDGSMRRFLAPVGEGILDWQGMLDVAPEAVVVLDLHRGQFAMPVFDGEWLAQQEGIGVAEYAGLIRHALRFGKADIPWDQAAAQLRYADARKVVASMAAGRR